MAVKTFTTGEVLTAANTNTYLNNGGLVYVTEQTIGTAVASQQITGCFSATYAAYRVVINGVTFSTSNNACAVRLGTSTTRTDYYWGGYNVTLSTGVLAAESGNATAEGLRVGYTSTNATSFGFDLYGPFLAQRTNYYSGFGEGNYVGMHSGYDNSAVSYADLVVRASSGTMTGGVIRVYGYRQA